MRKALLSVLSFLMPVLGIVLGGLLGLWVGDLFFTEPCDGSGNCMIPDIGPFLVFGLVGAVLGCIVGALVGKRLWPLSGDNAYGLKMAKK